MKSCGGGDTCNITFYNQTVVVRPLNWDTVATSQVNCVHWQNGNYVGSGNSPTAYPGFPTEARCGGENIVAPADGVSGSVWVW
ncbi:MAG: hypothetical protein OXR73_38095 [Myxococcales bacterium]|nr:hypothetical protein [Myxococcales bacterium]